MDFELDLGQEQRQRNLPRLIEANYLLHLSAQELGQVISTELNTNPALELDERSVCPMCGRMLEGGICPNCYTAEQTAPQVTLIDDPDRVDVIPPSRQLDGEDFDAFLLIADRPDLREQMLSDARAALPGDDHLLAEVIVEAIDERGFLSTPLDEIAHLARASTEHAEETLKIVQSIAPPGVGARDLRECLLLQVAYLRDTGSNVPAMVETIVGEHLKELAAHRHHQLARTLHCHVNDIAEAYAFIRESLSPQPLQEHQAESWTSTANTTYVAPDVIITLTDEEINVEIPGFDQGRLRLNPLYDELAAQLRARNKAKADGAAPAPVVGDEDRAHIRTSVATAKEFMSKLEQRRQTLAKISLCVCQMQEDFLRGGIRELRPLTRSEVAAQVGVHESTVSRATANKFVMLPSRKVIPFSDFFTASLSIKDVIKELVELESTAGRPLSDMRICEMLADRGYRIARRTVAKYRAELRILPSTIR